MATPSDPKPVSPAADHEELTGIYGFFRRHQKKLLYTAGLFTLLTFSVTGPMTRAFQALFRKEGKQPTIQVGSQRVPVTREDFDAAGDILAHVNSLLSVFPPISAGDSQISSLKEPLAILRRAAITEGFEVSNEEIDRALAKMREGTTFASDAQMAMNMRFGSLAEMRDSVREAMRISNYVRLQTLALDTSDATALQQLLSGEERLTFRAAQFDEKAYEEELKAGTKPTYEELTAWLDGKTEAEKMRLGVFDLNRVELRFGGLLLDEFDAGEWAVTALANLTVGDDQLKSTYEQEKERFKVEGKDEYLPFDGEGVKARLTRIVEGQQVMNYVLTKLRDVQNASLKQPQDELIRCRTEQQTADAAVAQLEAKVTDAPEDAAVKAELETAKVTAAAKKAATDAADAALKAARETFPFPTAFVEVAGGRKGFVQRSFQGVRTAEQLKKLDDLGFGTWARSTEASGLSAKGDLSRRPALTSNAVLLYQATDVLVRPLKAKEDLQPLLEGAYFTEKAKNEGEAKQKLMADTLLRMAKAKMPEKVAEIEGKRAERLAKKVADWETETSRQIAEAEKTLAPLPTGTQAHIDWQRKLDTLKAELAQKEAKVKAFETETDAAIASEVGDEAKKHHAEVLDAAAAEAGFKTVTTKPLWRKAKSRAHFDKSQDPLTVFLFTKHDEMKQGESTGVVQDQADRLWLVAVCDKVEPLTVEDITRREFEVGRSYRGVLSYAVNQAQNAFRFSFTPEALEARYKLERVVGDQEAQ